MMLGTSHSYGKRLLIKILCFSLAFVMFTSLSSSVYGADSDTRRLRDKYDLEERPDLHDTLQDFYDYSEALADYEKNGYVSPNVGQIVLQPGDAIRGDGQQPKISSTYGDRNLPTLVWDDRAPSYQWTFNVEASGLYEIVVEYIPVEEEIIEIQRALKINGEYPFRQAENIFFNRKWVEREKPEKDVNGDERSPRLEQIYEWNETALFDPNGMYPNPLKFYFEKGENTVTFEYISAPMAIGNIYIRPVKELPSYEEYVKGYSKKYQGDPIKIEAEEANYRSAQVLRRSYDSDPSTSPAPKGRIVQNTIGNGWNTGNKDITWVVNVPEDGLYKLAFRIRQNMTTGLSSHRQILINGEVPFKEVEAYPFKYMDRWRTQEIVDSNGEAYLFYLNKGQNEITLRLKTGAFTSVINELEALNFKLSDLIRKITKITSTEPDPNFNYELHKKIPGLMDDLKDMSKRLKEQADFLIKNSTRRPTQVNSLLSAAGDIDTLIKDPERIPRKLKDLNTMQTTLTDIFTGLKSQPLFIDYVEILGADDHAKDFKSTFWQKLVVSFQNFIRSFFKDYDAIGETAKVENGDKQDYEVIDVWVAREKQWAELIQQLTNEDFSREHNILVNINILPSGNVAASGTSPLMLSIISGKAPDVALGSDSSTPVELAIREAAYDLSQFSDFEEVRKRFIDECMVPFEYNGGTYALPETMDFQLMFYRTDILEELGIGLPDTWDELFSKTLPVVRQSGAQMLMPADFNTFLFQNGGKHYKNNNKESALDSQEAYDAFVKWTEAYTVYRVMASGNAVQHFRLGSVPIVVGTVGTYIQFQHVAPELYGKWDVTLIPGTKQPDGTIVRYAGGGVGSALMFTQTKKPEAAWEFLKWWTSTEIQTRFGAEIESIVGPEARWLSANVEAFEAMDWDSEHLEIMKESMRWIKMVPNVLGGYYTQRMINNAWTRTVLANMNPRDSLEQAVKDINFELKRKNDEYDKIYNRK